MKIGIIGCTGRMGRELLQEVISRDDCVLSGATVKNGNQYLGQDVSSLVENTTPAGIKINDSWEELCNNSDAIIDFTSTETSMKLAEYNSANYRKIHVIGTTPINAQQLSRLKEMAASNVIVCAPNMSIGINLIAGLLGNVVKILDSDYDVEILEMHHRLKKDSPSGTALMLAESMLPYMKNGGILPYDRNGVRTPGKIGIASLRGGAGAGEHRVIFAGPGECLEFTHKAHNRGIYAKGAVFAALWSKKQNSGLYSMQDVLFS